MSLISVIIVNWNGKLILGECLDTLRAQSHRADEIIVVDNGSQDGSQEMLRERYPEVRLIALDDNRGFSVANNIGIRCAKGDYIALLNNDLLLDSEWIEQMVAALDADGSLGSCACKMLFHHRRDMINAAGDGFLTTGRGVNRGMHELDAEPFQHSAMVFGTSAGAAMYRASMLRDIGLFDEDFFMYCEDVDLAFRAQLAGYNCLYVPEAIAYHHHSASSGRFGKKDYYLVRNTLLVLVKDMPTPLLRRYAPRLIAGQIPYALQAGMRGQVSAYARACLGALCLLPRTLRKRRIIQRRARRSYVEIDRLLS